MLNKAILMGRLTRDPEFRQTPSGVPVCRFSIAINRQFTNKQTGERETDFIDCVAWRQTAEFVSRYFNKGSMILVEGQLRNDNYTDNNGVKHYRMNVQVDNVSFCESKGQSGGDYAGGQQGGGFSQQGGGYSQNHFGGQQQGGYGQNSYGGQNNGGYGQNQYGQQGGGFGGGQQAPVPPQDSMTVGNLGDFEEILSDGEVPF